MEEIKFTFNEKQYINAYIDDRTQDIHRNYNSNSDVIYMCAKLPQGTYVLEISDNSDICNQLEYFDIPSWVTSNKYVHFIITNETANKRFFLAADDIDDHVKNLRKQVVLRKRELQQAQERLIKKDIKSRTDLGEDYNRESFYTTLYEYLENDETLEVDFTKSPTDKDVNVLQCAKLQQDKNRLLAERKEIDNEISQIEKHREELLKY